MNNENKFIEIANILKLEPAIIKELKECHRLIKFQIPVLLGSGETKIVE